MKRVAACFVLFFAAVGFIALGSAVLNFAGNVSHPITLAVAMGVCLTGLVGGLGIFFQCRYARALATLFLISMIASGTYAEFSRGTLFSPVGVNHKQGGVLLSPIIFLMLFSDEFNEFVTGRKRKANRASA